MQFFKIFCCLMTLSFWALSTVAQNPSYRWELGLKSKHTLSEKSALGFSIVNRQTFNEYNSETFDRYTDKIELKAGYYYSIKSKIKIGLAYMYRSNDPFESYRGTENRIIQQLSFKSRFVLPLDHRFRIAERVYEKETVLRLRYRWKFKGTIVEDTNKETALYYTIAEELLFSYNKKWTAENRFTLGLGYSFKNENALDFGLSNRYSDLIAGKRKNIFQLITNYTFKF